MNPTELAHAMLEWETTQRKADELAETIKAAVLEIGKTQTVGNVRASYSAGRRTFDYREAADGHPMVSEVTIGLFTTIPEPRIDWAGICKHAGIEDIPFTQTAPSVSVKLLKG
jgi:hypothetical protein